MYWISPYRSSSFKHQGHLHLEPLTGSPGRHGGTGKPRRKVFEDLRDW